MDHTRQIRGKWRDTPFVTTTFPLFKHIVDSLFTSLLETLPIRGLNRGKITHRQLRTWPRSSSRRRMQGRSDSVVRERRSEARCRPRGRVPDGAGAVGRKTPDREPEGVDVNRGPEALLPAPESSLRGGDDGIRTHDPHVANVMLSQLSYIPTYGALSREVLFCRLHRAFVKPSFCKCTQCTSRHAADRQIHRTKSAVALALVLKRRLRGTGTSVKRGAHALWRSGALAVLQPGPSRQGPRDDPTTGPFPPAGLRASPCPAAESLR